jgi:hypothetical protein
MCNLPEMLAKTALALSVVEGTGTIRKPFSLGRRVGKALATLREEGK